tara:strand:+ start:632 stop:829 length:198 start_codon:yes stop_codon:yes gene_type:complete
MIVCLFSELIPLFLQGGGDGGEADGSACGLWDCLEEEDVEAMPQQVLAVRMRSNYYFDLLPRSFH